MFDLSKKYRKQKSLSFLKGLILLVPYGFGLSNLIDDFQALRTLMNSRNWKSVF